MARTLTEGPADKPLAMEPILLTPRLILREIVETDLDFLAEMLGDPEVMRFYPHPLSREEAEEWLELQRRRYSDTGHGLWLALERASDRPIGQVGLIVTEIDREREAALTYLIHRPYWRRGYATQAARATLVHAFERLGYDRVITLIRPQNLPSLKIARQLGLVPEREVDFKGYRHLVFTIRPEDLGKP